MQEWMTRLIVLLMSNLNGDHDACNDEADDTHQSLFLPLAAHFGTDSTTMLVFFYAKILQLHLETKKSSDEEEKEFVCRDVLPRHLLRDMLAYGQ